MTEIAKFTAQKMLELPDDIAARFRPSDRFIVWTEGDTLHLKRITPESITDIIEQAPEGEALSLDEINRIVHTLRQQQTSD